MSAAVVWTTSSVSKRAREMVRGARERNDDNPPSASVAGVQVGNDGQQTCATGEDAASNETKPVGDTTVGSPTTIRPIAETMHATSLGNLTVPKAITAAEAKYPSETAPSVGSGADRGQGLHRIDAATTTDEGSSSSSRRRHHIMTGDVPGISVRDSDSAAITHISAPPPMRPSPL
mmetsp:Transcript_146/g.492  ORF Transcript_146/g.492 Transcript_146/m.492 type:complete len:176 (-) Transcript_146:35-562(-)